MSDELQVNSMFVKGLISRFLKKMVKSKLGIETELSIDDFGIVIDEKNAIIRFKGDLKTPKESLLILLDK